jgi:hypothetical protein
MVGICAGQPLDTLRVRLQQRGSQQTSTAAILRASGAKAGVRDLFRGMTYPLYTIALQACFCCGGCGVGCDGGGEVWSHHDYGVVVCRVLSDGGVEKQETWNVGVVVVTLQQRCVGCVVSKEDVCFSLCSPGGMFFRRQLCARGNRHTCGQQQRLCACCVRPHTCMQHIRRIQCLTLANASPALCSLGKASLTSDRPHHALTCTPCLCSSGGCVHIGSVTTVV